MEASWNARSRAGERMQPARPLRERELDLVLWGATGFVGRLVAEHLHAHYGGPGGARGDASRDALPGSAVPGTVLPGDASSGHPPLRWAIGGRDRAALEALRERLGAPALPVVLGDAYDRESLVDMARRTRVVCTTVGPYARYGSELVAVCAEEGVDTCDLTGEVPWMRRMLDAHEAAAEASGARIVHACGFDSIPSDLGTLFVQREAWRRYGAPSPRVKGGAAHLKGGVSGGTIASALDLFEPTVGGSMRGILADPYALNPRGTRHGPPVRDRLVPHYDPDFRSWTAYWPMAPVNTRIVRRSAGLREAFYGPGMRYEEAMLMGPGAPGAAKAFAVTAGLGLAAGALAIGPLRRAIARRLPQPGEGPDAARRAAGHWELRFVAAAPAVPDAHPVRARVSGDRDPGYGSTAAMLAESAVCLVRDASHVPGGFHTPASALGEALLERLERNAGIRFEAV